jgi:hypothetical protein
MTVEETIGSGRQDQRRRCGRLEEHRAGKDVVWVGPQQHRLRTPRRLRERHGADVRQHEPAGFHESGRHGRRRCGLDFLLRRAGQPESDRHQRRLSGAGGRRPILHQRGFLASGARESEGPLRRRDCRSGLGSRGRRHLAASDPAPGSQCPDAGAARHQRNAGIGSADRSVRQPDVGRGPKGEIRRTGS